jgi:hypothetical protein
MNYDHYYANDWGEYKTPNDNPIENFNLRRDAVAPNEIETASSNN